jgi:hypothetical protein
MNMKTSGYSVVRVYVHASPLTRIDLLDQARRQSDHLGPWGIVAKRRQTNRRFRRRGYLRLKFPTRRLARAYARRIERIGEPAIHCRLMRNPNSYR